MRPECFSAAVGLLLLWTGCANPVAPTGGPQDTTPPAVIAVEPPAEAVNVTADAVRIVFSEYVNESNFAQAFSVTPAFDEPLEYDWGGRSVTIRFPEALRANTTYILTLDTQLRDVRGVALAQPITVAFSTGPVISRGRLAGRVVEPVGGEPVAGIDVYAYPAPDSVLPAAWPERPAYRTQTGDDGRFQFDYLTEQPYFVAAVRDANRNRQPDATEVFAVPPRRVLFADTVAAVPALLQDSLARPTLQRADTAAASPASVRAVERLWVTTSVDTTAPSVRRVRPLSRARIELRFDEAVAIPNPAADGWTLRDFGRTQAVPIEGLYVQPTDPRALVLETDALRPGMHTLTPGIVTDSSGNAIQTDTSFSFDAVDVPDTLGLRLVRYPQRARVGDADPSTPIQLPPGARPRLQLNQYLGPDERAARLSVLDTLGQPLAWSFAAVTGTIYEAQPPGDLPAGAPVTLQLLTEADTLRQAFQRLPPAELGSRSGVVSVPDAARVVLELRPANGPADRIRRLVVDATGPYRFTDLPAGAYALRAFVDRNGNARWDGGRLLPYAPAEPIRWVADSLTVRPRWDTALDDTLRVDRF